MNIVILIIRRSFYTYFVLQSSLAREAGPQGVFQLRLKQFHNKYATDSVGNCCSGDRRNGGRCSGRCNTKFRVCLKHYMAQVDYASMCTFGEEVTSVVASADLADLSTVQFDIDFKWPVSLSISVFSSKSTLVYRPTSC